MASTSSRPRKKQMDQQWDGGAAHGYVNNLAPQQASRYPGSQAAPGSQAHQYYPGHYPAYPHQYPPQNAYSVPSRQPYDSRGAYPYHYYPPYQPSNHPVHNSAGYFQGTAFHPGFSPSPGRHFQQTSAYPQAQLQHYAEDPAISYPMHGHTGGPNTYNAGGGHGVNLPQSFHPTNSVPPSLRPSRPLVPTVAPFLPSLARNVPSTNEQNPLMHENPISQIPSSSSKKEGLYMEEFPPLPHSETHTVVAKAKHTKEVSEASIQSTEGDITTSEHSSSLVCSHCSQKIPEMNTRSHSTQTSQVDTVTQTPKAMETASINSDALDRGLDTDSNSIDPIEVLDDSIVLAVPARPTTASCESHPQITDKAAFTYQTSNTISNNKDNALLTVCPPPGIDYSDGSRLQNLMAMEGESRVLDALAALQKRQQEGSRREHAENNTAFRNDPYTDNELFGMLALEMNRAKSSRSEAGQHSANEMCQIRSVTGLNLVYSSTSLENEREYNRILSDPKHEFWDTPPNIRVPLPHLPTSANNIEQLVSIFRRVFENLTFYAKGYSNLQACLVPGRTRYYDMEGQPLQNADSRNSRAEFANWAIPEAHDSPQSLAHFRNNACHVPYMGPPGTDHSPCNPNLTTTTMAMTSATNTEIPRASTGLIKLSQQSFSSAMSESPQPARLGSHDQDSYWGFKDINMQELLPQSDILPQTNISTLAGSPDEKFNRYPEDSIKSSAEYGELPEGVEMNSLPRIVVGPWEPDQTPRPSFAEIVRSYNTSGLLNPMENISDLTPEDRFARPPHESGEDISSTRKGSKEFERLPKSRSRSRRPRRRR